MVSARRTRLTELAEQGNRRAKAAQALRRDPERFFATVQIGITVVSSTAAALGGSSLAAQVEPWLRRAGVGKFSWELAFVLVVGGISYLSLVIGELVPKSLGLRYAEGYALMISPPLRGLARVTKPLVWLLTFSSNLVLRFFGDRTTFTEGRMSAEELQLLVEDAARQGSVDTQTSEIASRAFELNEVAVGKVMVPRNRMTSIERNAPFETIKQLVIEGGHSRVPVQDGGVDNVVGYIMTKDLLALSWAEERMELDEILRPAFFVPETMKALDALRAMQKRRLQLAIVVDERGMIAGLVTVEDLVEELVGEIVSEHEAPVQWLQQQEDGVYLISGGAPIRDLNRELEMELPEGEGYTTIAGLAIFLAGRIPAEGEKFELEARYELEVLEASPKRVRRVALRVLEQSRVDQETRFTP